MTIAEARAARDPAPRYGGAQGMIGGEPRVSILSFSPFQRDARVLRQARFLAEDFSVTVFAYDWQDRPPPPAVSLRAIAPPQRSSAWAHARRALWLARGRLGAQDAYDHVYWSYPLYQSTYRRLRETPCDLLVGNDWNALPIVARVSQEVGAPFVIDLHEDALGQHRSSLAWQLLQRPVIETALRCYGPRAATALTVSNHIADLYEARFGWRPKVLRNVPDRVSLPPFRACDPSGIRLVHHGVASPTRGLETMIEAVVEAGPRFSLDLYLVGDPAYLDSLATLIRQRDESRVRLRRPVAPAEIVATIAHYDLGLYILQPTVPQHRYALPNKLFDFLAAGLAVAIGPSPEMASQLATWDAGFVAEDFSAGAMARLLRELSGDEVDRARRSARAAAEALDARREHAPLLSAARAAIGEPDRPTAPRR